jgi:hypothetical protein
VLTLNARMVQLRLQAIFRFKPEVVLAHFLLRDDSFLLLFLPSCMNREKKSPGRRSKKVAAVVILLHFPSSCFCSKDAWDVTESATPDSCVAFTASHFTNELSVSSPTRTALNPLYVLTGKDTSSCGSHVYLKTTTPPERYTCPRKRSAPSIDYFPEVM